MRRSHNRANTIDKASKKKSKQKRKRKGLKGLFRRFFSSRRSLARRLTGFAILAFLAVLIVLLAVTVWKLIQHVEEKIEAKKIVEQHVHDDSTKEAESLLAGREAVRAMDYDAAAKHFAHATELNPKSIEAWAMLADVQRKLGNEQDALVSLRRRIELPPESARPHFISARIYRSQGKTEDALQSIKEAVRLAPLDPLFSNTLYILRIQNGELDQVREELDRMSTMSQLLEPTFIFGRAAVALAQGNKEASIRHILRARDHLHEDTYNTLLDEEFFASIIDKVTVVTKVQTGELPSGGKNDASTSKEIPTPIVEHVEGEQSEQRTSRQRQR